MSGSIRFTFAESSTVTIRLAELIYNFIYVLLFLFAQVQLYHYALIV